MPQWWWWWCGRAATAIEVLLFFPLVMLLSYLLVSLFILIVVSQSWVRLPVANWTRNLHESDHVQTSNWFTLPGPGFDGGCRESGNYDGSLFLRLWWMQMMCIWGMEILKIWIEFLAINMLQNSCVAAPPAQSSDVISRNMWEPLSLVSMQRWWVEACRGLAPHLWISGSSPPLNAPVLLQGRVFVYTGHGGGIELWEEAQEVGDDKPKMSQHNRCVRVGSGLGQ